MEIETNLNKKLELVRQGIEKIDVKLSVLYENESLNSIRINDLTEQQNSLKEKRDLLIIRINNLTN
jgi:hypothetical protein